MDEFKEAVRLWNVKRGRSWYFDKNERDRCIAKCSNESNPKYLCGWFICAARRRDTTGFIEIRKFQDQHTCPYEFNNKSIRSGWVAKNYVEYMRDNPKASVFHFKKHVMKENKFFLSRWLGYRARKKALVILRGSYEDQYAKLYDYALELKRSNPGTTVEIKKVDGNLNAAGAQPRFERIYVCFGGVKEEFLKACRPWFGIDGTFLKGPTGGVLLAAVGVDPNNGLYPIAYAIAEGESGNSWSWFLTLLRNDLRIYDTSKWTIMSDKQKGLRLACDTIFPNAEHRFCVKHLHGNWSDARFKGFALRRKLWAAAKATTPSRFREKLASIAKTNKDTAKWLDNKPRTE